MIDSLINTLLVIAGLYVYLSLFRQVAVRQNGAAALGDREFGVPEAAAAILLIGWFALNMLAAAKVEHATFQTRDLLITAAFSLAVISSLTVPLRGARLQCHFVRRNSPFGFGRTVSTAAVLLFAAYPLLLAADGVSRWLLGDGSSKQQIIEMFTGSERSSSASSSSCSRSRSRPWLRSSFFGFFYMGFETLPRSRGRVGPNLLLFAAVHVHLPSLGPLFILGECFTLAYEWSGSILVSMTMHAFFNFLSLSALAFPNLISQ